MSWYNVGTISVTNGSNIVTGAGTLFVSAVLRGEGVVMPNGVIHEIDEIISDTSLQLSRNYTGSTASAQAYSIVPIQDYLKVLAQQAAALLLGYQNIDQIEAEIYLALTEGLALKVDKETGKGLSQENFTTLLFNKLNGIEAGAQVNVATNIAQGTRTATTVPITSSTGTGATLAAATTTLAGVMLATDKVKLNGVAEGATKVLSQVIDCTSLKDFFTQCLALGSGFYRVNEGGTDIPSELRYSHGYFSTSNTGTWSFTANSYTTGRPMFYAGLTGDIAAETWKVYDLLTATNIWSGTQQFTNATDATSTTTGALRLAGGLGVAKALHANSVTTPAVLTQSMNGGQIGGRRNKIHNGAMRINQRGMYATAPGPSGLDRWFYGGSHDGVLAFSNVDVTSNLLSSGFTTAMRIAVSTADTAIAAGQAAYICQRIEGFDVIDLVGQTFTFSCWARTSFAGTYCLSFRAVGGDRSWVTAVTLAANTWTKVVTTIPAGLPTGGTWNYTNGVGLEVAWALACGTSLHTATVNAWTNTAALATSANANLLGAVGRTFDFTGVQLEHGDVATPFELMGIEDESRIVQRYLQNYSGVFNVGTNAGVDAVNLNRHLLMAPMRTTPTISQAFSTGTGASWLAVSNSAIGQGGYHSAIATTTTLILSAEL